MNQPRRALVNSKASGDIQRSVGFGRLNYPPILHQSVWVSVNQGEQESGVRWEEHGGLYSQWVKEV